MSTDTLRILLLAFAAYMLLKTATAPRRGRFLTALGNIDRVSQPGAFRLCLIAGYMLATVLLLGAAYIDRWLPMFAGL